MNEFREMFRYGTWANVALLDFCAQLPRAVIVGTTTGTFGPIRETFVHMLDQERWGLGVLGREIPSFDESSWESIRSAFLTHGGLWQEVFDNFDELGATALPTSDDWEQPISDFPLMYALQTAHHQELHRTQIRTTLGSVGQLPEEQDSTDVWAYWQHRGLLDLK